MFSFVTLRDHAQINIRNKGGEKYIERTISNTMSKFCLTIFEYS